MALSPDGKIICQPSFEKDQWYVLDALTGDVLTRIASDSNAHKRLMHVFDATVLARSSWQVFSVSLALANSM